MLNPLNKAFFLLLIALLFAAHATPSSAAITPPFKEVWAQDCHDSFDDTCTGDGILFFSGSESIGALDIASGKKIWRKSISGKGFGANLDYSAGVLYASIGQYKLVALDPKTGKERWSIKRKGYSGPIRVYGNTLFGELNSGTLAAVDLKTKKTTWSVKIDGSAVASWRDRNPSLGAEPVMAGNRLFVASESGEVICLNPASGKLIWRYKMPVAKGEDAISFKGLLVDGKRVYATHDAGGIVALDLPTGRPLWSFRSRDRVYTQPAVFGGLVTFSSQDGRLYALDADSGTKAWEAILNKMGELDVSTPVVISGQLIVASEDELFAFDATGKQLWTAPVPDIAGSGIQPTRYGLLLRKNCWFGLVVQGKPTPPPTDPQARLALAQKLVSRYDKLNRDDKRMLRALGYEGFEAMLPLVRQSFKANAESGEGVDDASMALYNRLESSIRDLLALASAKHTAQLVSLTQGAKSNYMANPIYTWLAAKGDEHVMVPVCLEMLNQPAKTAQMDSDNNRYFALEVVSKSRDPLAVSFMVGKLDDPDADPETRRAAFLSLARTGGDAGVAAVVAAKSTTRTIPPLTQFMGLANLPFSVSSPGSAQNAERCLASLLDVKPDTKGTKWGLIECPAVGSSRGTWVARQENKTWTDLRYIDTANKEIKGLDWISKFTADDRLAKDSDADGWADNVETRIGTNPNLADTDSDGLKDSEDMNPLAAPRPLGDFEQVLTAAFEARFRFAERGCIPMRVYVPDTIAPFELMGYEWITLCANVKDAPPYSRDLRPEPNVTFRSPQYDFDMAKVYTSNKDDVVLWNQNKTQAKVHIVTYYGSLSATGFDVTLRKIDGNWLVVEMQMIWVS